MTAVALPRVMIVDDEPLLAESLRELLSDQFDVSIAATVADGKERLRADPMIDVVLCDLHLHDGTGLDLYRAWRDLAPGRERRLVFFTGGNASAAIEAQIAATGNVRLDKPFDLDKLITLMARIAAQR
jgi:two-component system cell cycle sensor histidine kinase/response regulator CckA